MANSGQRIADGGERIVPWTGSEILLGVFLTAFFWPSLAQATLQGIGFFRWYYVPDAVAVAQSKDSDPDERRQALSRMGLWSIALASPLQVLTIPLLFASMSGTRPDQLGLTRRRLGRNVLAGLLGTLVLTPVVLGIYQLVQYLMLRAGSGTVEQHGLTIAAAQHLSGIEWALLVFTATIAAPVSEEVMFRGAVQPWLTVRPWGSPLAMLGALALTIWQRADHLAEACSQGMESLAAASIPVLFVLALVPIYALVWWRSRTPLGPAIFGTAALFASVHASVWPTPIPLFVLALGLGVLAHRTRSLVGPIVLHGTFNGVSCVQLLVEMYRRLQMGA
jgi:membrane protease YdiL (CAAX protease family)